MMDRKHWTVTVERDGENVVTIGHNHLSGRDLLPGDEEAIVSAARSLLGFVGVRAAVVDYDAVRALGAALVDATLAKPAVWTEEQRRAWREAHPERAKGRA